MVQVGDRLNEGEARQIACMEVWGGNGPVSSAVSLPGNDVYVACRPWTGGGGGGRAGGDIYFMSNCLAGAITRFVLADVAGHGEAVDELALSLRRLMRKHINTADQTRLARALNTEFGRVSTNGRFATALIATYFAPTDHLIICNAGHPAPLWYRADEQRWSLLRPDSGVIAMAASGDEVGVPNLPLGILEPMRYAQFAVRLGPGDAVVLYTDALMEARGAGAESGGTRQLGEEGLLRLCQTLPNGPETDPAADLIDAVIAAAGGSDLDDDATVISIRHHGGDPPRMSASQRLRALGRLIGLA